MITAGYAGVLGLLFLLMSFYVIARRAKTHISFGGGGDAQMERRMRAHGNFAEYAPFILLLMALAELGGAHPWAIHLSGGALALGRLLHAIALALTTGWVLGRFAGMIATFIALLAASVAALSSAFQGAPI